MKPPKLLFAIFVVVALAQLALPSTMIWQHEWSLQSGRAYKFRTAPVDPYDAFRGRYVALQFEQASAPLNDARAFQPGRRLYAAIEEGPDGFARFREALASPPPDGDYIRVRAVWYDPVGRLVRFNLPFDRFYMEESVAPEAERAYQEHSRHGRQDAYVIVRVRGGRGVIENLYVSGKPIAEYVRAIQRE